MSFKARNKIKYIAGLPDREADITSLVARDYRKGEFYIYVEYAQSEAFALLKELGWPDEVAIKVLEGARLVGGGRFRAFGDRTGASGEQWGFDYLGPLSAG